MTAHRITSWYLVAIGVLLIVFGIGDVVAGVTADPGIRSA
jgi:hypothetical protein